MYLEDLFEMTIARLTNELPCKFRLIGDANTEITALCTDSRKEIPRGCLFFCISGLHSDAHDFAGSAVERGAAALVVERELNIEGCPQIVVENVRLAMSYLAAAYYGYPARSLKIIGITGTEGKTTTSFLLKSILEAAGKKVGLIGTVCTLIGDVESAAGKTTPDPVEFQQTLRLMADAKVDCVVMEVSAHALAMHRIAGVNLAAAGITNISLDHLDYFGNMDNYLNAKLGIIDMTDRLVVNVDDERVNEAIIKTGAKHTRIGIRERADDYARDIEFTEDGLSFLLCFHKRMRMPVRMRLTGIFNVYNALMAAALADMVQVDGDSIRKGLESVKSVPGRIELLDTHTPYRVILDYAHSPDALENVLETVRETAKGRVISLFGCGGGRDHTKRPVMGEISGRLADISVITSDNPRDEEPNSIIADIVSGIKPTGGEYIVIENRREAIRHALTIAKDSDVVLLAGKGHEVYQEINGVKHPFDEKVIVQELLDEIAGTN